jgi:long-chain acyl-CoA synthetase
VDLSLTLADLFLRAVAQHGEGPALLIKQQAQFFPLTWKQLAQQVAYAASALADVGVRRGSNVVQISENRREWIVLDLACYFVGAVHVPLHATLTGPQLAAQIKHSGVEHVFLSTLEQAKKLQAVRAELPSDVRLFAYDELEIADLAVVPWRPLDTTQPADDALASPVTPDDVATILYTSGTTGPPKGVMLTQRNLSSNAQAIVENFGEAPQEVRLNILPLSHIFARTCDLYSWLVRGSTLALAESRDTLLDDLQAVQPTTINGVPYLFDRLRRLLHERGLDRQPGVLRQLFGGRIRSCSSGGAALSPATIDFFAEQEVLLLQGYGLTETSPVITMSTREANRPGTCGRPLPDVEVQIADDGEVLTRGPHVMLGYYKDPAATAATIQHGWLHTGDIGEIDTDGYLRIIDRKKEMIVLSTGKKVSPALIENRLSHDPLIGQVMVVGEGRSHLAALIVPVPDPLRGEILARQIPVFSREQALVHPQVLALYLERIAEHLADLSSSEQVRHVLLIPRPFSAELGEMTAKLSLRREVICEHFAQEIDAMYAPPPE